MVGCNSSWPIAAAAVGGGGGVVVEAIGGVPAF